jgi:hypothetical protein
MTLEIYLACLRQAHEPATFSSRIDGAILPFEGYIGQWLWYGVLYPDHDLRPA